MQQPEVIALNLFCELHKVEINFIEELEIVGIIEIVNDGSGRFLKWEEISVVERCIRLHADLNINAEGILTIGHLTDTVNELQDELRRMRSRLSVYEEGE
jgi:chaperone modulatory protein CbpM